MPMGKHNYRNMAGGLALTCLLFVPIFGQPANVAAGKVLLSQLTGDAPADAAVFRQVGPDRAQQLLSAVLSQGQSATATRAEWTDMHHAIDGIVALNVFNGELLKASIFASFNDIYYRNNEKDRTAALGASMKSLDLMQQSKKPETLYLNYNAVAENLLALGRVFH